MTDTKDNEVSLEELKKQCAQSLSKCITDVAAASKNQNEYLINFGLLGIKYTFMLNGAAAIAVTTMFTSIFLQKQYLARDVLQSILFFCYGAGLSVIAAILLFIAVYFYKSHLESIRKGYIDVVKLLEGETNKIKPKYFYISLKSYVFYGCCIFAFVCVFVSLWFSWKGIITAAYPFETDLITKQATNYEKNEQTKKQSIQTKKAQLVPNIKKDPQIKKSKQNPKIKKVANKT